MTKVFPSRFEPTLAAKTMEPIVYPESPVYTSQEAGTMFVKMMKQVEALRGLKQMDAAAYEMCLRGVRRFNLPKRAVPMLWELQEKDKVVPTACSQILRVVAADDASYLIAFEALKKKGHAITPVMWKYLLNRHGQVVGAGRLLEWYYEMRCSWGSEFLVYPAYAGFLRASRNRLESKMVRCFFKSLIHKPEQTRSLVCLETMRVAESIEEVREIFNWYLSQNGKVGVAHITARMEAMGRLDDMPQFAASALLLSTYDVVADPKYVSTLVSGCTKFARRKMRRLEERDASPGGGGGEVAARIAADPLVELVASAVERALDTGCVSHPVMLEAMGFYETVGSPEKAIVVHRDFESHRARRIAISEKERQVLADAKEVARQHSRARREARSTSSQQVWYPKAEMQRGKQGKR